MSGKSTSKYMLTGKLMLNHTVDEHVYIGYQTD